MNNLIKYNFITKIFFQIFYSFRIREILNLLQFKNPDIEIIKIKEIIINSIILITILYLIVINKYRSIYIDIKNIIVFVIIKIKKYYNINYIFKFFEINNLVNLKFYKDYQIFIICFKKIGIQLVELFKIFKKIDRFVY